MAFPARGDRRLTVSRQGSIGLFVRLITLTLAGFVSVSATFGTENPTSNASSVAASPSPSPTTNLRGGAAPATTESSPKQAASSMAARNETLAFAEISPEANGSVKHDLDQGQESESEVPQPALPESEVHEQPATPRRVHYHVGLTLRQVFDDNINLSQTDRKDDLYTTIEPTINVGIGDPAAVRISSLSLIRQTLTSLPTTPRTMQSSISSA